MKQLLILTLLLSVSAGKAFDAQLYKNQIKSCAKKSAPWLKIVVGSSALFLHTVACLPAMVEAEDQPFSFGMFNRVVQPEDQSFSFDMPSRVAESEDQYYFAFETCNRLAGILWRGEYPLTRKAIAHAVVFIPYVAGSWLIADGIQDLLAKKRGPQA